MINRYQLFKALAQTQKTLRPQHAEFMGIPIDGELKSFTKKLVAYKKFKVCDFFDNYTMVSGDLYGYYNCSVFSVTEQDNLDNTYKVEVYLTKEVLWDDIVTEFRKTKTKLEAEFGPNIYDFSKGAFARDFKRFSIDNKSYEDFFCKFIINGGFIFYGIQDWGFHNRHSLSMHYYDEANMPYYCKYLLSGNS